MPVWKRPQTLFLSPRHPPQILLRFGIAERRRLLEPLARGPDIAANAVKGSDFPLTDIGIA
jgi:hypothetical protein